jgi:hypothetical protein
VGKDAAASVEGLSANTTHIKTAPHNINQHLTATFYNQLKEYTSLRILKWIEESQVVIHRCITATNKDQAAIQHNMTLLDDIATQLKLTPDLKMYEEDQELRALKFYTTDGSHKILLTYADILTSHQDQADCGKRIDGILFMEDKTQSIERHSIRVV